MPPCLILAGESWGGGLHAIRSLGSRGVPVYVLHGEADDNVPPSEGRAMVAAMEELGIRHQAHFEPGAGRD